MSPEERLEQILQIRSDTNYSPSTGELQQRLRRIQEQLAALGTTGLDISEADLAPGVDPRITEAETLEQQASQPRPMPQGFKENLVQGLRAGIEGFSGGLTGGPGFADRELQRENQFRLEQGDRLERAKALRDEARQQQQLALERRRISGDEQEQQALQDYRGQQLELEREKTEQGRFASSPQGIYDVRSGEVTTPAEAKEKNLQHMALVNPTNGKLEVWAVDMVTGDPVKKIGDAPPPSGQSTTLSPYSESNIVNRLVSRWDKQAAVTVELGRQVQIMDAGMAAARRGDLAQGSQAVLITFQKILDPTSVVRESEYLRSAAGQSLQSRMEGVVDRLRQGGAGVPLTELEKYAQLARELAARQNSHLVSVKKQIEQTADRYRIPRELVTTGDLTSESNSTSSSSSQPKMGDVKTFPNGKRGRWDGQGWELIQ